MCVPFLYLSLINTIISGTNIEFERSQSSVVVYLNSAVFWDVTQRRLVSHRRFAATCRSHLQRSKFRMSKEDIKYRLLVLVQYRVFILCDNYPLLLPVGQFSLTETLSLKALSMLASSERGCYAGVFSLSLVFTGMPLERGCYAGVFSLSLVSTGMPLERGCYAGVFSLSLVSTGMPLEIRVFLYALQATVTVYTNHLRSVVSLRPSVTWSVTQRWLVASYRRFGTDGTDRLSGNVGN
jgi:hypothetical protein